MIRKTPMLTILLALALAASGCRPTPAPAPSPMPAEAEFSGKIIEAGSTTVQPLAEKLAEAFMARHPKVEIIVQGGGSSVGVKSAGEGTVDVGAASREVKDSEKEKYPDLVVHTIAYDGIAIVVHPEVPIDGLTMEQVRDIFAGKIANWKEVGGPDKPIVVVSREEGSGTRACFEELVMGKDGPLITEKAILQPSNGAVRTTVATTPYSIGYLSFGFLDPSIKGLALDGVKPTVENVVAGKYPVVRPLNLLTKGKPTGVVKAWLDFILCEEGQKIVVEEGYIAVR